MTYHAISIRDLKLRLLKAAAAGGGHAPLAASAAKELGPNICQLTFFHMTPDHAISFQRGKLSLQLQSKAADEQSSLGESGPIGEALDTWIGARTCGPLAVNNSGAHQALAKERLDEQWFAHALDEFDFFETLAQRVDEIAQADPTLARWVSELYGVVLDWPRFESNMRPDEWVHRMWSRFGAIPAFEFTHHSMAFKDRTGPTSFRSLHGLTDSHTLQSDCDSVIVRASGRDLSDWIDSQPVNRSRSYDLFVMSNKRLRFEAPLHQSSSAARAWL